MTYRERRERKAERLREWAEKRQQKATAVLSSNPEMRHDWAFITQPGHIPERARMNAADDRAHESIQKAEGMERRADGIEHQLDRSIYSDDPDAPERLKEKIAALEAARDRDKAVNTAIRAYKRKNPTAPTETILADLVRAGTITEKEGLYLAKSYALQPYHGLGYPAYHITNLGANIRRQKERLAQIERDGGAPWKYYSASRYPGTCLVCSEGIEIGSAIIYRRGTDEVKHFTCYEKEPKA